LDRTLKRLIVGVGAVVGLIAVAVVAVAAYVFITAGSGEASVPISAPTLAMPQAPSSETATPVLEDEYGDMVDEGVVEEEYEETEDDEDAEMADGETGEEDEDVAMEATETSATTMLFRIAAGESEVRFLVGEVLDGDDKLVVGTTDQVAGDILIDFENPAASQLGQIRTNVRTLRTDSSNRDRAVRSFVLESGRDQFEFAEFDVVELVGLPDSVVVGDVVDFHIEGTLMLKGIAAPVTFDATVTIVSESRIEGSAVGSVRHDAYDLRIPDARGRVTAVDDVVVLEIDFVAPAVTE
jgi:polyisoprenoid-binding protein YceI